MNDANFPPGDLLNLAGCLAGLAALWIALGRGWRSWGDLEHAPVRRVNLGAQDIAAGVGFWFCGNFAFLALAYLLGIFSFDGTVRMESLPVRQKAEIQLLGQLVISLPVVAYLVFRVGWHGNRLQEAGILPRQLKRELLIGVLAYPVAQILIMLALQAGAWAAELLHRAPPMVAHESLKMMKEAGLSAAGLLLIGSALLAAPLEEMMFRGLLQTALQNMFEWKRRWPVVVGVALAFALVHFQAVHWATLPGLFVLGLVLGCLYEWTGSLLPGILVHLIFNAFNMAMVLSGAAE